MDPLSVTASIVSILQLSSKVVVYLTDVKDASKDRARCAIEASNLHSLLLNLRFRLEEGVADNTAWFTAVRALAVENGPLDQFKLALETLQTKMTDGSRLKKTGESLVWKFKKEEITGILDQMERLKSLVEIALQMDHFKLSQAIKDDTNFVRTHVPVIQSGVATIQLDQDSMKLRRLLDWISLSDYPAQQSDIIKRRQKGTGQWFLNAPEVALWLNEPKSTLFCPGIPGAGKTMVAAITIDYLLRSVRNDLHAVAYVYCNYKTEKQDASSMLAAILKQLVQRRPSEIEPVDRLYQQHASQGTKPSLDEIYSALRDVLAHYSTAYIVIDALDECQDSDGTRRQFLAMLRDLQEGHDMRLMVTSRFIPEIEDFFTDALRHEIRASKEDVKCFVAGQIYRLPRCIQRDATLQEIVQERIVEAVDGMFLLARLHIDSLLDKRTAKDVKSTLTKFAKGAAALEDAYREAIQRIEGQLDGDHQLAKKVLSWITLAERPLTTVEICCALAVEADDLELDPEKLPDKQDIVSVCAGLVVVDEESAIIRLVHYTAQEYFERITDTWNPAAQTYIATTCLTYLCFDAFKSGSCSNDKEFKEKLLRNNFLNYAAKHWGQHVRLVEAEANVARLASVFLLQGGLVASATQVQLVSTTKYSRHYPENTPLHCTSVFGLRRIAEKFLTIAKEDVTSVVNAKNGWSHRPLTLAAAHGHWEMVEMLLGKGADVNAQGGHYGSALQAASKEGHEQAVKVLLDRGAEVNEQGGFFGNALQAASYRGQKKVVQLLLDNGANVSTQGGHYGNALQAASYEGQNEVVKLLLDNGANANAQGGRYGNALQAASYRGQKKVVQLLLDNSANTNAQGGRYINALNAAFVNGNEQIVKLLLGRDADVNLSGYRGDTTMSMAAFHGHTSTLQLILSLPGVTPPIADLYGRTLLWWAAAGGQAVTVNMLMNQYNLDARKTDQWGRTPLWIARKKGHDVVAKILYEEYAKGDPKRTDTLEQVMRSEKSEIQSSIVCDVCTSRIEMDGSPYYHCQDCAEGDWDICEDCRMRGASCMDAMHTLMRRTVRDGIYVDEAS